MIIFILYKNISIHVIEEENHLFIYCHRYRQYVFISYFFFISLMHGIISISETLHPCYVFFFNLCIQQSALVCQILCPNHVFFKLMNSIICPCLSNSVSQLCFLFLKLMHSIIICPCLSVSHKFVLIEQHLFLL